MNTSSKIGIGALSLAVLGVLAWFLFQGASLFLTQYEYPTQWGGHVRGHEHGGQGMGISVSNSLKSDADGMLRVPNWPTGTPAVFTILGRPESKDILKIRASFPVQQPERKDPRLMLFRPEAGQTYTVFLDLWKGNTIVVKGSVLSPGGFDHYEFDLKLDLGEENLVRIEVDWQKDRFEARYHYPHSFVKSGLTKFTVRAFLATKEIATFGPYDYYRDTLIQGLLVDIK